MVKRIFTNRLNDLEPKEWLKFQKSWFIHNPPPRKKDVLRHPAKFPETLAQEFIEFFTRRNQVVLDPMVGTGSTLVAALRAGRHGYGIELNPAYAAIARQVIAEERQTLGEAAAEAKSEVLTGSAAETKALLANEGVERVHYVLTSPPYWDMLRAHGAETQRKRRQASAMDVFYSEHPDDLGNITDYDEFLARLAGIYQSLQPILAPGAYMTIIVKNIKKGGRIYPLAWDLARLLSGTFILKDERIWCQNDQRLAPFGLGSAWVSNTFHHYCLQFRNQ